jgi:hypothetical protein
MPVPVHHRRGAALTIALVILAALLLLGIPFLYLQSSGLGGFKAYAQQGEARRGLATAEALGMALALYATQPVSGPGLWDVGGDQQWDSFQGSLTGIDSRFTNHGTNLGTTDVPDDDQQANPDASTKTTLQDDFDTLGSSQNTIKDTRDPSLVRSRIRVLLEAWRGYERQSFPGLGSDDQDAARLGLVIEDESGKLDPNDLSAPAWDALLKAVLGRHEGSVTGVDRDGNPKPPVGSPPLNGWLNADWDDDRILIFAGQLDLEPADWVLNWDSNDLQDPAPYNGVMQDADPNEPASVRTSGDLQNYDQDDLDRYGQLAQALANLRADKLQGARITDLEQLLLADPGHNTSDQLGYTYGKVDLSGSTIAFNGNSYGFRKPLSRPELELLRPYLTLHSSSQGRNGGLTDLGTVVRRSDTNNPDGKKKAYLDSDIDGVLSLGSYLVLKPQQTNGSMERLLIAELPTNVAGSETHGFEDPHQSLQVDAPVLVELPASVNLQVASDHVRSVLAAGMPRAGIQVGNLPLGVTIMARGEPGPVPLTAPAGIGWEQVTSLRPDPDHVGSLLPGYDGFTGWDLISGRQAWNDGYKPFDASTPPWLAPRQAMPPVDIRGYGIFTLHAASDVASRDGNPVTRARSNIVVQAVPSEQVLERRWLSQADMVTITAQNHASRCTTGPVPIDRVLVAPASDPNHNDHSAFPSTSIDPNTSAWIQARPEPNLATGFSRRRSADPTSRTPSHLNVQWRSDLGLGLPQQLTELMAPYLNPPPADEFLRRLGPDGLDLKTAWSDGRFGLNAEPLAVLPHDNSPAAVTQPFHLALWVKVETVPTTPLTIWRSRGAATMSAIDCLKSDVTTPFPQDPSNQIALTYLPADAQHAYGRLRLTVTPWAAGPPTSPRWFNMPVRDLITWSSEDGRTTGNSSTAASDSTWDGGLYPSIWLEYSLGPNGLSTNRWYHIQTCLGGPGPGSAAIIVDGIVGRDAAVHDLSSPAFGSLVGDHVQLPFLRLATLGLPGLPTKPTYVTQGSVDGLTLDVTSVLGHNAVDQLPERGVIRMNGEWLAYSGRTTTQITGVRRGVRQTTNQSSPNPLPVMGQHDVGSYIQPGGMTIRNGPRLWRGGSTLATNFPNTLSANIAGTTISPVVANDRVPLLNPVTDPWPAQGIISISTSTGFFIYNGFDPNLGFLGLEVLNNDWRPAGWSPTLATAVITTSWTGGQVKLCGVLLDTANGDPADPAEWRYALADADNRPNGIGSGKCVQLLDPANGACEWVGYDTILRDPNGPRRFLFAAGGFSRSEQRTEERSFPMDAAVIPCQFDANARFIAGDLVSVIRDDDPYQSALMLVRWAAEDALPSVTLGSGSPPALNLTAGVDATEGWFAFTAPLPWRVAGTTTLTVGHGTGELPRLDRLRGGTIDIAPDGGLFIDGLCSGATPTSGMATLYRYNRSTSNWELADDLPQSWDPTAGPDPDPTVPNLYGISLPPSPPTTPVPEGITLVQLDGEVVACRKSMHGPQSGLLDVLVDDPAPPNVNNWRIICARNLLIDPAPASTASPASGAPPHLVVDSKLPALILPIGPVAMVTQASRDPGGGWFQISDASGTIDMGRAVANTSQFDAPAALVWPRRTGSDRSIVQLIGPRTWVATFRRSLGPATISIPAPCQLEWNGLIVTTTSSVDATVAGNTLSPILAGTAVTLLSDVVTTAGDTIPANTTVLFHLDTGITLPTGLTTESKIQFEFTTAPWLTGLYGTNQPDWRRENGADVPGCLRPGDLVIGWWPRYNSPLPGDDDQDPDPTERHYRSRLKSWVGYPFRLHGAIFDPGKICGTGPGKAASVATINILDEGGLSVCAHAMANGWDWKSLPIKTLQQGDQPISTDTSGTDAGGIFASPQFVTDTSLQPVQTDGAELRITWHLPVGALTSGDLSSIADRSSRTPRIGAVRLRCLAPTMVLGTETER